jgi:Spy/CpxP family protein refolding chaperone
MKRDKSAIVALTVIFLMTGAVSVQAQDDSQQPNQSLKERVYKELNLTPEQQKKLDDNRNAQKEEMARLLSTVKEKRTQLQEALKNPTATIASAEPLVQEIKSLQGQLIDYRIKGIFMVKEILTPEQFAKFQEMTAKHQEIRKRHLQGGLQGKRRNFSQSQEY